MGDNGEGKMGGVPTYNKNWNHLNEVDMEDNKWRCYVVMAENGHLYEAIWLNKPALLSAYEVSFRHEDPELTLEDVKERALEKLKELANRQRTIFERVRNLSDPRAAKHYSLTYNEDLGVDVLLLEYVPWKSLPEMTKGLAPIQMIPAFVQVFESIRFQHQNDLLHLNIKKRTFRASLLKDGEVVVKMMNYGYAVPKGECKGLRGPITLVAPEVAFGHIDKVDERADLYSLGGLLYYCLSKGHYPFEERLGARSWPALLKRIEKEDRPTSLKNYNPQIPDQLEEFVMNLLLKDPDKRPFRLADDAIHYIYEQWPEASKEMVKDYYTITLGDEKKE